MAASVISMGLISLPIMMRYGYDKRLASGVITASGTLAQIIPPSLVLIVLADQLGRSVGDMYKAAMIPALALTGIYLVYVMVMSILRPSLMPALPPEARSLGSGGWSLLGAILASVAIYVLSVRLMGDHLGDDSQIWAAALTVLIMLVLALADEKLRTGI
ncbi:TRAP dicarboxylate transporter subunit DctM, partial [marine sediment metagenome]